MIEERPTLDLLIQRDEELMLYNSEMKTILQGEISFHQSIVSSLQKGTMTNTQYFMEMQKSNGKMLESVSIENLSRHTYQGIVSKDFEKLVNDGKYKEAAIFIAGTVVRNTLIQIGWNNLEPYLSSLQTAFFEFFENYFKSFDKTKGVNCFTQCVKTDLSLGLLMILFGVIFSPGVNRTWEQFGLVVSRETAKATLILTCSWIFSIPGCVFVDDFFGKIIKKRTDSKMWYDAITESFIDAVYNFPFIGSLLKPKLEEFCNEFYDDNFCHENFKCPIELTLLREPLSLHGHFFSGETIRSWLEDHSIHPFTRREAIWTQLTDPTDEFKKTYIKYGNRRASIIRNYQSNNST
jgi:hypothetical protein